MTPVTIAPSVKAVCTREVPPGKYCHPNNILITTCKGTKTSRETKIPRPGESDHSSDYFDIWHRDFSHTLQTKKKNVWVPTKVQDIWIKCQLRNILGRCVGCVRRNSGGQKGWSVSRMNQTIKLAESREGGDLGRDGFIISGIGKAPRELHQYRFVAKGRGVKDLGLDRNLAEGERFYGEPTEQNFWTLHENGRINHPWRSIYKEVDNDTVSGSFSGSGRGSQQIQRLVFYAKPEHKKEGLTQNRGILSQPTHKTARILTVKVDDGTKGSAIIYVDGDTKEQVPSQFELNYDVNLDFRTENLLRNNWVNIDGLGEEAKPDRTTGYRPIGTCSNIKKSSTGAGTGSSIQMTRFPGAGNSFK